MNTKAENTLTALRLDLNIAVEAYAARIGLGRNGDAANVTTAKAVYEGREQIVEAVLERLRRNWTVTERARSQRRVPPR